jgi:hypothetical protein
LIHDRDSIYSKDLDASVKALGLVVLKTPYKSPQANSFCERLIGTARRECLDFTIPFNEAHSDRRSNRGRNITIVHGRIPAWARERLIGVH